MRFSIRTLFLFTTAVAVTAASLSYANPIIGDLFYTLGLLTIAFATLAAIYRRGPQRAFWVGFVVLFAGYFCHTVWPSELRVTWLAMQSLGNLGVSTANISTTKLLNLCFEKLYGTPNFPIFGNPYPPNVSQVGQAEQYISFMTIGHTAIAFLLGVIGGAIARRFALQSQALNSEPNQSAAATSESNGP